MDADAGLNIDTHAKKETEMWQRLAGYLKRNEGFRPPDEGDEPNAQQIYEVTWADLPLQCPLPRMSLWNSHPKVYLPIHVTGKERCPYCSAAFVLKTPEPGDPEPFFGGNIELENAYRRALEEAGLSGE